MARQSISTLAQITCVLCLLAFSPERTAGQDSVLLKPKLEPGRKYYLERLATITQGVGPEKTTFHLVDGAIEEVKGSSKKGIELVLTLDRSGFRAGRKEIGSFDTDLEDKGQSPVLGPILRAMVGAKLTLKLDKKSKVKSCKGAKDIVKKVEKKAAGNPLWSVLFKNGVNDENYRTKWGDSRFVLYPNKEVRVGDTWKNSYVEADPQIGRIQCEFEMKLERIEPKDEGVQAFVAFTKVNSMVEGGEAPEAKIRLKSGQSEGTAVFDSKQGQFVKIETKGTSTVETSMMGRSMEIQITGDAKLTLISLKRRQQQKEARSQGAEGKGESAGGDD